MVVLFPHGKFYRTNAVLPQTNNNIQFRQGFQTTALVPETTALTTNVNANAVDILFYPD